MNLTIITGLSGAGRTTALKVFEDMGFYAADNIPPTLIPSFVSLLGKNDYLPENIAVVADIRMGALFDDIYKALETLKESSIETHILFLDASDKALISRFEQTRRKHPLSDNGLVTDGIIRERMKLQRIKELADCVIDTSDMKKKNLEKAIYSYFEKGSGTTVSVSVITFGFKRGIPLDVDMLFDVRFIPNPFYQDELKYQNGLTDAVSDYVFSFPVAKSFVTRAADMVTELTPHYLEQDKKQLVIGIGCTGGMHRSVAIGSALKKELMARGMNVTLEHRDMQLEEDSLTVKDSN